MESTSDMSVSSFGTDRWDVLVVDMDQDLHGHLALSFNGLTYLGKTFRILHAGSPQEALELLGIHKNIRVAIVDAGLDDQLMPGLAELHPELRIVALAKSSSQIRTVAANSPAISVIKKSEMSSDMAFSALFCALRSYHEVERIRDVRDREDGRETASAIEQICNPRLSLIRSLCENSGDLGAVKEEVRQLQSELEQMLRILKFMD